MNLHQYLTHKRRLRRGGSAKTILVEVMAETGETKAVRFIWSIVVEMRLQIYLVESGTRPFMSILWSVCPLCILYAFWLSGTCSFVVCHSFGDIWLVELKPCVTYSFPVRFNRSMSGTCTSSTGLTFLPPDNKNSYPFHVRRFNPVKCDRGFKLAFLINILSVVCRYVKIFHNLLKHWPHLAASVRSHSNKFLTFFYFTDTRTQIFYFNFHRGHRAFYLIKLL